MAAPPKNSSAQPTKSRLGTIAEYVIVLLVFSSVVGLLTMTLWPVIQGANIWLPDPSVTSLLMIVLIALATSIIILNRYLPSGLLRLTSAALLGISLAMAVIIAFNRF